jgi:hypothetical protein
MNINSKEGKNLDLGFWMVNTDAFNIQEITTI